MLTCGWYDYDTEACCGLEGEPYISFVVCQEHKSLFAARQAVWRQSTARQSAQYFDLSEFPGFCYFALRPDGTVKIGYSNTDVLLRERFRTLSRELDGPVIPLAVIHGGFVAEAVMHDRFREYRIAGTGERFQYSGEMAKFISELDCRVVVDI